MNSSLLYFFTTPDCNSIWDAAIFWVLDVDGDDYGDDDDNVMAVVMMMIVLMTMIMIMIMKK